MGKKKVVEKSKEEQLKEKEQVDQALEKGAQADTSRNVRKGRVYVASTYNNTTLTLTDDSGDVLTWSSAGKLGFSGTKKGTSYAATRVGEVIAEAIKELNLKQVKVLVKGIGSGRESAVRSLASNGVNITSVKDVTPIPHNGCRPPKPRRV
ncbi:30S ribosomal protein S11 [candidate division MSBL1 archaeon SCGC-AAA382N08]|uniref:Small ribosomal subunit protein uS11 n=1 Tax=candidate division MSBL1 archaeon SCGC-AAA382N08 TaxID=1698285 RepID=A0A133VR01_9EURY|nr:30S ribosomal protein S11 [candidate division MSBL1 archaeon SCGC-AAA382N08]